MRQEYEQQTERYYRTKNDLRDNQRVLETLKTLNEDRPAYRIIGDIVSKQTVGELKPSVEQTIS